MFGLILILLLSQGVALGDEIDLGARGVLTISVADDWSLSTRKAEEIGYGAALKPKNGVHAKCLMTIAYLRQSEPVDRATVEKTVRETGEGLVRRAARQNLKIEALKLKSGYGAYTLFSGVDLRERPQKKDDYRVVGTGIIRPTEDVIIVVTLYADSTDGAEMKTLLETLNSLNIARSR